MTVYIVHYYNRDLGESVILGVFNTKDKAEAYAKDIHHYTLIDEQQVY